MRRAFRSGNFLSHRSSTSVSSKFLLTTLNEQSAGADSYRMMAFEIVCQDTNPLSCASFKRTDRLFCAIFQILMCKEVSWLICFNTRSKHWDVHGVHGRAETRLLSVPNSNSSCKEISFGYRPLHQRRSNMIDEISPSVGNFYMWHKCLQNCIYIPPEVDFECLR